MELQLVLAEAAMADVSIKTFMHSGKGVAATSARVATLIKAQLEVGIAIFIFRKKDGTLRQAIGTLSTNIIPVSKLSKVTHDAKEYIDKINYFDLECQEFRAFSKENAIAILIL